MSNSPKNDRLEELFLQALEQPDVSRDAWMVQACAGDADLLVSLRKLIRSNSKNADGLLDGITAEAFSEQTPTRIGVYHVSKLVGTGGMSAVFDAVHSGTNGRAAVKVIRVGLATARQRIRLQMESELLARLNHPGIARLFDAGQAEVTYADGSSTVRMFIAMELVDGANITNYCNAEELTIRQRVELTHQVSRAVQHAHESGVIHRDLKPANILVTPQGLAKVVDFGIARLLGSERHVTMTGVIMGTPSYMSPEQMAGKHDDVNTRADVYSLGAVLYEMLTGRPPIEAPSALTPSAAFAMLHAEPTRVMAVKADVPRDLDAIVHKALDRKAQNRYPTARELADDLERWLKALPVEARQPSVGDRVRLQFRRRPKLMAGLLVGTLSLFTLGSLAIWQAVRATRASQVAMTERNEANKQRDEAVRQSTRADQQTKIAQAVSKFLRDDVLGQANSEMQANTGLTPDPDIKISTALDLAAKNLDTQFKEAPAVEASIRYSLGMAYNGIGKPEKAMREFRKAQTLYSAIDPNSVETIDARSLAATALGDTPDHRAAADELKMVYQDSVRLFGKDHPTTIEVLTNYTVQLVEIGEHAQAIPLLRDNVERATRTQGESSPIAITNLANLAYSLSLHGGLEESLHLTEQILDVRTRSLGRAHPLTILSINNLTMRYIQENQDAKAIVLGTEGVALARPTLGIEHPTTLILMNNLARALDNEGRTEEALAISNEVYATRVRVLGAEHPDTLFTAAGVADRYFNLKKYAEALEIYQRVYAAAQRVMGEGDFVTLSTGRDIVPTLSWLNRHEEALALARQLLELHLKYRGQESPHTVLAADLVVQELIAAKRFEEAEPIAKENQERAARVMGVTNRNAVVVAVRYARILERLGKLDEAAAIRATTRPSTMPTTSPAPTTRTVQ